MVAYLQNLLLAKCSVNRELKKIGSRLLRTTGNFCGRLKSSKIIIESSNRTTGQNAYVSPLAMLKYRLLYTRRWFI